MIFTPRDEKLISQESNIRWSFIYIKNEDENFIFVPEYARRHILRIKFPIKCSDSWAF